MAGDYGTLTSLADQDNMVKQVLSLIPALDPKMHVLLNNVGQGEPVTGIGGRLNWQVKNPIARTGTIAEDLDNSEVGVDVTTGEGVNFRKGDVFKVDSELFLVSSVSTDTVTVATRPIMGSTAATHSSGAAWTRVSSGLEEDATIVAGGYLDVTEYYNLLQQFVKANEATDVERGLARYGGIDKLEDSVVDMLVACRAELNWQMFNGVRTAYASGTTGFMGGLKTYIPQGNSATAYSSDPISRKIINTAFQDIMNTAGNRISFPDIIVCSFPMKQAIGIEYAQFSQYNRNASEKVAGVDIETIVTNYGNVRLLADMDCPTGEIYFLNLENIKIHSVPGNEWRRFEKPINKVATQLGVAGAYSMSVQNPKTMIYLSGLSESYT